MAANRQLIIETAKEIMIAAMQKHNTLIFQDSTGENVADVAKNIAENFKIVADGLEQTFYGLKDK